jgi:L-lactate dehydrogenase complex protein LldE
MAINVSFFSTCLGDTVFPDIGIDSVRLLRKLGCTITYNPRQTCCGQPLANSGFHHDALPAMRNLVDALLEDGCDYVVAPSGSCVLQVKEYPKFFKDDPVWKARSEELAARIWEITDFIVTVLGVTDVGARLPGRAAYHPSCHLTRLLGVREQPLALLENIRDLELVPFAGQDRCCGFGGAFAVKLGALSGAMVEEKVENIREAGVDYLIGADGGCLLNIKGRIDREGLDIEVLHVVQALMRGLDHAEKERS